MYQQITWWIGYSFRVSYLLFKSAKGISIKRHRNSQLFKQMKNVLIYVTI